MNADKIADALREMIAVMDGQLDPDVVDDLCPNARKTLAEYDAQPAQAAQTDIFEAYKTWPADIREKLSLRDLRRMSGWVPSGETGGWSIDTSTPSPILTYQKCSVIQDEQAYYVLDLIRMAAQSVSVPDGFFIGGPHATAIVHDRAHIEPVIAALCSATGDDTDDYTVTDLATPQPPAQPSADAERLDFIADHVPFGALDSFGGMSLPVGSDDVRNDLREAIDDAIRHSRAFAARAAEGGEQQLTCAATRELWQTRMEWKPDTRQYTSGSILYLGKWPVGGSHYDAARNRNDPKKYRATCRLPGIKDEIGCFETDVEARQRAEGAVKYWLGELPSNS